MHVLLSRAAYMGTSNRPGLYVQRDPALVSHFLQSSYISSVRGGRQTRLNCVSQVKFYPLPGPARGRDLAAFHLAQAPTTARAACFDTTAMGKPTSARRLQSRRNHSTVSMASSCSTYVSGRRQCFAPSTRRPLYSSLGAFRSRRSGCRDCSRRPHASCREQVRRTAPEAWR
jgi:hypothetical protein